MEFKKALIQDMVLYAVFLIAAVTFHIWIIPSQTVISIAAKADFFAPDTFPKLLAKVIAFFSAVGLALSIVRYVRYRKTAEASSQNQEDISETKKGNVIPFIVIALIWAYICCFHWTGFIPATVIFPPAVLFVVGGRNWKHYLIYYIFAAAMYILFKYIMLVPIR